LVDGQTIKQPDVTGSSSPAQTSSVVAVDYVACVSGTVRSPMGGTA